MTTQFEAKFTENRRELHGKQALEKAGIPVPEHAISPTTRILADYHNKAMRALGLLNPSPSRGPSA